MVQQSIVFLVIKSIFFDTLKDVIRFPFWWYTVGLKRVFFIFINSVKSGEASLGVSVWVKNISRPMYGQYDWTGRIISFLIRILQIFVRSVLLVFWVLISFIIVIIWIVLPIIIFMQLIYQITGIMR